MIKLIVFLPLLGFLYCAFVGSYFHDRVSQLITTFLLTISTFLSWIIFLQYLEGANTTIIHILNWITSGSFSADWSLRVDAFTATMMVVVTTV